MYQGFFFGQNGAREIHTLSLPSFHRSRPAGARCHTNNVIVLYFDQGHRDGLSRGFGDLIVCVLVVLIRMRKLVFVLMSCLDMHRKFCRLFLGYIFKTGLETSQNIDSI